MSKRTFIFFALPFLIIPNLWASGWNNTLMGCKALALGGAFVGVADDPSAIFHNPAGLVFQRNDFNISIDGFYIWPTHEYTTPTGSRAQSKYDCSLPQIFFSYRVSDKLTFGFGFYAPYAGGGVEWKEEDLGFPFKSTMGIYTLTPTLAYKVSEKLSVGLNLNLYGARLNVDTEMQSFGTMSTEENGSAFSGGLGLMFRPTERVGIGISIRGPAKMELSGKTKIIQTIPGMGTVKLNPDSETSFNLPWDIEVGCSFKIAENILLSTSAQYTMWSVLAKVDKTIRDLPNVGDYEYEELMNFEDILTLRAGMEYTFSQGFFLRGGFGLDRCANPDETLSFKNIDVDKITLLGGIGFRTGVMEIDLSSAYAIGKEREKDTTEKYNLSAFIMGLGINFSF